ncbi:MAG: metallophosphoesterase family protein [Desulfobacterales bacterium]|nr:metallophosphoesterase family protein [Desulfobacterales bacterium]
MILIGLSDIHGETAIIDRMGHILSRADAVLLAGDITHFSHAGKAERVVEAVRRHARCVLAVPGNCDHNDVNDWLEQEGINLHCRTRTFGNIGIAGLGGSIYTPFNTPFEYSETQVRRFLSDAAAGLPENLPFVLVSHQPPADTACDRIRGGRHVGSRELREFIETYQPLAGFTGHIHESVTTDHIGRTKIVNPGQLRRGCYAYAEITSDLISVEIRSFK